jgi:membrane-bound lytic murein transglycosylase B
MAGRGMEPKLLSTGTSLPAPSRRSQQNIDCAASSATRHSPVARARLASGPLARLRWYIQAVPASCKRMSQPKRLLLPLILGAALAACAQPVKPALQSAAAAPPRAPAAAPSVVAPAPAPMPTPAAAAVAVTTPVPATDKEAAFVAATAQSSGMPADEIRAWLDQARYQQSIINAITRPAEGKPWKDYRPIFLTADRINNGRSFYAEHKGELDRIAAETGVPAQYIVAIIGVETSYGKVTGSYRVLDALYTLGFF